MNKNSKKQSFKSIAARYYIAAFEIGFIILLLCFCAFLGREIVENARLYFRTLGYVVAGLATVALLLWIYAQAQVAMEENIIEAMKSRLPDPSVQKLNVYKARIMPNRIVTGCEWESKWVSDVNPESAISRIRLIFPNVTDIYIYDSQGVYIMAWHGGLDETKGKS
jgi:hypothetical protein